MAATKKILFSNALIMQSSMTKRAELILSLQLSLRLMVIDRVATR
ncbi:MAG: hypothetical protein OK457_00405 [Thaumarchaeota archaeon]|nr:hypothetical protein [Nitrososphaerota archaeon]